MYSRLVFIKQKSNKQTNNTNGKHKHSKMLCLLSYKAVRVKSKSLKSGTLLPLLMASVIMSMWLT